MAMIPESFVQDLLARIDVVDVISRYVTLRRAGANLLGLCPFHQEKSPSFTVSPTKQFYHCFGCGVHGTAIGFLMQYTGVPFPEAIESLAHSAGLSVPKTESLKNQQQQQAEKKKRERLVGLLEKAYQFYRNSLRTHPAAINYLKKRGVTGEVAKEYGIGWAPEGLGLESVFAANYNDNQLVECGLVVLNADGRRYDRFRGRIIFPILDQKGYLIGFGGRVLQQQAKGAKYLNSPETPLFSKGQELYGLWQARQAIRQAGYVLVVEGYMDVVSLAQKGLQNVVATLGTATTHYHIRILLRYSTTVVFSFDGDSAGKKAAWKALESSLPFLQEGTNIRFLFLPEEHDPDSYVRQEGEQAFQQQVKQAMPLSVFLQKQLAEKFSLEEAEGRAAAMRMITPVLQAIQGNMYRTQLVHEVAKVLRLTDEEILRYIPLFSESSGPLALTAQKATLSRSSQSIPTARTAVPTPATTPANISSDEPPDWHQWSANEGIPEDSMPVSPDFSTTSYPEKRKANTIRPMDYQLARLLLVHPFLVHKIDADSLQMMREEGFETWVLDFIIQLQSFSQELPHMAAVLENIRTQGSLLAVLEQLAASALCEEELPFPEQELTDLLRRLQLQYLQRQMQQLVAAQPLGEQAKQRFYDLHTKISQLRHISTE